MRVCLTAKYIRPQALAKSPKFIRGIAVNKAPLLFDIPEPKPEHLRKARAIAEAPGFRERVGRALASRFDEAVDTSTLPVEKQIYAGFYADTDRRLLEQFQKADWKQRRDILPTLQDARLRQLGRRLLAFHTPELLSSEEHEQFVAFVRERWSAPDVRETEWTTLEKARNTIVELRADEKVDQHQVDAIAAFITQREQWLS